jgi:hypothetical protein
MRHERDTTGDSIMRLTVPAAAGALGISAEAVRQRIKRGTLPTEKDAYGTVFVLLDAARTRPSADSTTDRTLMQGQLDSMQGQLDSMQEQITFLRAELVTRNEELRRKDHIIAALTERIPHIEAPREPRDDPETPAEAPRKVEGERAGETRRARLKAGSGLLRAINTLRKKGARTQGPR